MRVNTVTAARVSDEYIAVNSCGRQHLFEKTRGSYRPKGRADYHILYIAEGRCFVRLDGEVREAAAGSVVVFLPWQPQEYSFRPEDLSVSYYVHFTGAGCEQLLRELCLNERNIYYIGKSPTVERLLNDLVAEYRQSYKYSRCRMNGILLEVLAVMGRKNSNMLFGDPDMNRRFGEVCEYIRRHYGDMLTVKSLADMCGLSESRFSHRFTELLGVSPKRYLMNVRMETAKELLLQSDMTVSEIGAEVGIEDGNYFSRSFKRYCGMSPTEFRNES